MEHWIDWHLSICNNMVIVKYQSKRLMHDAQTLVGWGRATYWTQEFASRYFYERFSRYK